MRLLLLKICVGAMYFIIGCSQIQVSGEYLQPKQLIKVKQENLIRPGYYSYEISKNEKNKWENNARSQVDIFPKKYNDLLKSPENIFKILHKLVSKSESLEGKQGLNLSRESRKMINKEDRKNKEVIKGNYRRFLLNSANLNKQEINKNFNNGKVIGFGNYLERIIQHSAKSKATCFPKFNLYNQTKEIHEIPKIRKVRDIFPPLVNFKGLQNAIKASAYFSIYKDGNLSSFEHFDFHTNTHNFSTVNNASQETPRLIRSIAEEEKLIKKKSAVSKFLLELQDTLETVKFLTDGMFYPRVKDSDEIYDSTANDTSKDEKVTRKIRQLNNEIDSSASFRKKLIEMNKLTESITKSRCNCLVNKSCDLERKTQETEHENCKNYEEILKIMKNLNSLLRDFVNISVGDLRKKKNFNDALMKLSDIKLKKFWSALQKLRKQLSNNIA